jgi:spore cortex biosynthesis protein YabQ
MTLDVQFMTMIVMAIGGIFVGFSLETYRRLSVMIRDRMTLIFLLEGLFWLSQTAILFYLLYRVNEGQLRFYIFLAILLGYSIYVVLLKHIYQKVLEGIIIACKTIFKWLIQAVQALLIQPIIWLVHILYLLITSIIRFIWRIIVRILSYPAKGLLLLAKKMLPEGFLKKVSKFHALCSTIKDKLIKRIKHVWKKWRK